MTNVIKPIAITCLVIGYPFLSAYLAGLGFASFELLIFAALTLWRGFTATKRLTRLLGFLLAAVLLAGAYFANTYFVWLLPSFA